jgi:hypothetical protein
MVWEQRFWKRSNRYCLCYCPFVNFQAKEHVREVEVEKVEGLIYAVMSDNSQCSEHMYVPR